MKTTDKVTTEMQSQQLKHFNVYLKTEKYYIRKKGSTKLELEMELVSYAGKMDRIFHSSDSDFCDLYSFSAFDSAELGMLLPDELLINDILCQIHFMKYDDECWMCGYSEINKPPHNNPEFHMQDEVNEYTTEAQSRADCLIWLLENELIKIKDLKL